MKHRIVIGLLLVMAFMLAGCSYILPSLSKPQDAVDELFTQDSLMDMLSQLDDFIEEDNNDDAVSRFWGKVFSSPNTKALMLDNIRLMSYTITDVSTTGNYSTVSTLITHLDMSSIVDRSFEIFADKIVEMDKAGVEAPDNEDEAIDFILNVAFQSYKEAIANTKPTETYTKVRFECTKNSSGIWELREIPEDFIQKVMLMNLQSAIESGLKNLVSLLSLS